MPRFLTPLRSRSEEHTSELQSRQYLHSFPTRRSSDLVHIRRCDAIVFEDTLDRLHEAERRIVRRGGHLADAHLARVFVQQDRVGKGAADVNAEPVCHDSSLRSAPDRKSTRLNSSHANIYTLSLHDALPI